MKVNVGKTDRVIRFTLGTALLLLGFFGPWGLTLSIILTVLGVVMFFVGFTRFCPIYTLFGMSTCKLDGADHYPDA